MLFYTRLQIGKDLTNVYWRPGNGEPFLGLVQRLTGAPLTADAWVDSMKMPVEQLIKVSESACTALFFGGWDCGCD